MRTIILLALLAPLLSMCQPLSLKGKLINEQGDPIPGATIMIKRPPTPNTQPQTPNATDSIRRSPTSPRWGDRGGPTQTNNEGEFTITYLHIGDTVTITAIGYEPQTLLIDPGYARFPSLTLVLKKRTAALDEVMIMAYGTTTRRLSTGSITKVTAEDIGRQPVANPLAALEGLVPGLFVSQANGLPGTNIAVQLRGLNSLRQGTQPLFIVDGVPFMLNSGSLGQVNPTNNNIFNTINPADIQSIEVLKDADATAIYGSQGANGVVLITTKKGRAGTTRTNLSYSKGWGRPTRLLPLLNTEQYLAMRREAFKTDGFTPTPANAPDLLSWDSTRYTDWQNLLVGGTARTHNIQASLSGGSATTNFVISTGWYTETGVFPGDHPYRRGTLRLSLNHNSTNNRFGLTFAPSFAVDKKTRPVNDLTAYTLLPPNAPDPFDAAGNLAWATGIENPLAFTRRTYEAQNRQLSASLTLRYNLLQNLTLRGSLGYNTITLAEEARIPIGAQRPSATTTGTAQWASALTQSWVAEPWLEYRLDKRATRLTLLGGASWQQRSGTTAMTTGTRYTTDDLLGLMAAAGQLALANGRSLYRYAALFSRATFALKERYILNASIRHDGSSRFGPDRRFATFSSVGGAWIFSAEPLLESKAGIISFGKLRFSAGITGNDQVGDYQYLDSWTTSTNYQYNGAPAGVLPARLYNPAYQWEKVTKLELGLDLGFLRDRLLLSLAAYRNRSGNQLLNYKLPLTTGFSSILQNLDARIQNTGLEAELTAKAVDGPGFSWRLSANISVQRNKLLAYPGLEASSDRYNFSIGQPLRVLFAYRYTGIDRATGVYTFQDLDADGLITTPDLQVVGTPQQDYFGGLTSSWTWKGLELSCLWQFVQQKGRSYLSTLSAVPGTLSNQPLIVLNRWTAPGDDAPVQRVTTRASTDAFRAYNLYRSSSASLADASFIRLRNLALAWHLPMGLTGRVKASAARLFVEGQNLLTITSYPGADPETQSLTSLPPLRMLVAGISITF